MLMLPGSGSGIGADLPPAVDPRDGPGPTGRRRHSGDGTTPPRRPTSRRMEAGTASAPTPTTSRPSPDVDVPRRRRRLHLLHDRPVRPRRRPRRRLRRADPPPTNSPPGRGSEVEWPPITRGSRSRSEHRALRSIPRRARLPRRAAVKYGRAINHAVRPGRPHQGTSTSRATASYEIELSVDETEQPTTLAEHYDHRRPMRRPRDEASVSLAAPIVHRRLREGGRLQGGRRGQLEEVAPRPCGHRLRDRLGPYKLSLHSGSDKLSMYPALRRATKGKFHVKTPGPATWKPSGWSPSATSVLFRPGRRLRPGSRYEKDKATYVTSRPPCEARAPPASERLRRDRAGTTLPRALVRRPGRARGSPRRPVDRSSIARSARRFTRPRARPGLIRGIVLEQHVDTHTEVLADHFSRHLLKPSEPDSEPNVTGEPEPPRSPPEAAVRRRMM